MGCLKFSMLAMKKRPLLTCHLSTCQTAGLACEGDKLLGVVVLTLENEEDGEWCAACCLPAARSPVLCCCRCSIA